MGYRVTLRSYTFYNGLPHKEKYYWVYLAGPAVTADDANQPFPWHFNSGSHNIFSMKIRALCCIPGSYDSRKTCLCLTDLLRHKQVEFYLPVFFIYSPCARPLSCAEGIYIYYYILLLHLLISSHAVQSKRRRRGFCTA